MNCNSSNGKLALSSQLESYIAQSVTELTKIKQCNPASHLNSISIYFTRYQELIDQIAEVEVCVARAQSVRHKILGDAAATQDSAQHLEDLVLRLLDSPEVSLEGGSRGPAALAIRKLFQQARKVSCEVKLPERSWVRPPG